MPITVYQGLSISHLAEKCTSSLIHSVMDQAALMENKNCMAKRNSSMSKRIDISI